MMGLARLPVAPRPYRDELLSSWMARVACRYGLTAPDLADYFGDLLSPLHIDDGAPAAGQTRVWAQICGVDPDRVFRLSLRWRYPRRTRAWYASRGPEWMPSTVTGSTPVCLVCFADDQSAGRDGYLRACWMFAERCICPAHGELMLDRCPSCHRHLSVAFRLLEGRAQPACISCGSILADRGGEGGRPHNQKLVRSALAIQQRITERVDRGTAEQEQLENALSILWAPLDHPGAARPVLALWFNEVGWRCPYDIRHAVGVKSPLGLLTVRGRFLTLIALNDVFGTDLRSGEEMPSFAAHLVRRAAPRREWLSTRGRRPQFQPPKRSSAEYERLARQILADPRWIAAESLSRRKRERVRARLIDAALAGAPAMPPGDAAVPGAQGDPQVIQIS